MDEDPPIPTFLESASTEEPSHTFLPNHRRRSLIEVEAYFTSGHHNDSLTHACTDHPYNALGDVIPLSSEESHYIDKNHGVHIKQEDSSMELPVLYFHDEAPTDPPYFEGVLSYTHTSHYPFPDFPDPCFDSTSVRDSRSSTTSTLFSSEDSFPLSTRTSEHTYGCTSPCSSAYTAVFTTTKMRKRYSIESECEFDQGCSNPAPRCNHWCVQENPSSVAESIPVVQLKTEMSDGPFPNEEYTTSLAMNPIHCQKFTPPDCSEGSTFLHDRLSQSNILFRTDFLSNANETDLFVSSSQLYSLPGSNEFINYSQATRSRCSRQTYPHCSTYKHSYRSEPQRERIHRCPVQDCLKAYTKSSHLRAHMKMHTGEKPHVCEYCGRRYVRKDELKRHQIQHTGEKKYSCFVCGKKFGRSDHAKKHVEIKHPSQVLELENRRAGGRIRWDSQ